MSSRTVSFVKLAERYLSERRALGFDLCTAGRCLLTFARFADERLPEGPLTVSVAVDWRYDQMLWMKI